MPIQVKMRPETRIAEIEVLGGVNFVEIQAAVGEAIELVESGRADGIFFDVRLADIRRTPHGLKREAEDIFQAIGPGIPFAYIPPAGLPLENVAIIYVAALEHGALFDIIHDPNRAVRWLTENGGRNEAAA